MVGEFGLAPTSTMESVLEGVIKSEATCGALLWSLRFHSESGGFCMNRDRDMNS